MHKVLVVGSPGAGKSHFSRELQARTGLPLYPLDLFWHNPDRTTVSLEEFAERVDELIENDSWILDGTYINTLPARLLEADTVFFLDLPDGECLQGVLCRIGTARPDFPYIDETPDPAFIEYVRNFSTNRLPLLRLLLESYRDFYELITFRSRDEAQHYLATLPRR